MKVISVLNIGNIVIGVYMPLEDGETRPNYPRPPCAPGFIKSGLIPILHQYFTHSLYVYAGVLLMPPRVLGQNPAGAINANGKRIYEIINLEEK